MSSGECEFVTKDDNILSNIVEMSKNGPQFFYVNFQKLISSNLSQ